MNRKLTGTVLLGAAMLFAACGGETAAPAGNTAPKAENKPATTTTTTPTENKPMDVSMPDGSGNAAVGKLAADFPKDIPVYTGATVTSSAVVAGTASAVLSTDDAIDKVAAYYKDELGKNGWTTANSMNAGGNTIMRATKEKRQLAVTIGKGQDGKTSISLGETKMP